MRCSSARCALFALAATVFGITIPSQAQSAAAVARSARVTAAVDAGQTVRLSHHVPPYADVNRFPSTALAPNAKFAHLAVQMSRSASVEASFEQLLADQVNPSSPRYHQWLTPQQVGTLYGPAQADVDAVTGWLRSQGLTVNSVSANRLAIDFSGPVSSVEKAFGTSFRLFSLANGEQRYSLVQEPSVPAALQPVIAGVAGLSQVIHHSDAVHRAFVPKTQSGATPASPDYTVFNNGTEYNYLFSGDFNTAYDVTSTLSGGTTGSGQHVAIIGLSRVSSTDIQQLAGLEGITTSQPNVIVPPSGVDPGATADGDEGEATLDVDRVIGTAPGASIDLVVSGDVGSGNTYGTDGLFIGISYAISTLNDPILSISFGGCEYLDGQSNTNYEASFFSTAAAQGISTFISSGDSGVAGCNFDYPSQAYPTYNAAASINELCASPYVTCVGGTEFAADAASPTTYWSSTNTSTYSSLQTYIPEGAWNDVVLYKGTYATESGGSGGGTSLYIARPSWQTGAGVPAGSFRLVPDLAFTASAEHDGFVVCTAFNGGACTVSGGYLTNAALYGGTSAAAPSMAAIQALADQKLGARQGNINPTLYTLGNAGTAFHDVTVPTSGVSSCSTATPSLCNNSTPAYSAPTGGLAGYTVNAGYDEVTGWGSLDVGKYLTAVSGSTFSVTPASTTLSLSNTSGSTITDGITLTSVNNFAGTVALTCAVTTSTGATGSCSVAPTSATLAAGGTATSTLTITNTSANSGTLLVTVTGTSGTATVTSSSITVTVSGPTFTFSAISGGSVYNTGSPLFSTPVLLNSVLGFAGTVNLSCTVTSSGTEAASCALSPAAVALTANGTATSNVTLTNTTAGSGTLTVTVTGTGSTGSPVVSTSFAVVVSPPTFSITASPTALSTTSGTAVSTTATLQSTSTLGSFAGLVNLSCSLSSGSAYYPPTCTVSPGSLTLAANGTATATVTVNSTAAMTSSLDRHTDPLGWRMGGGATLALLLFCAPLGRRRRKLGVIAFPLLLVAGLGFVTGCSGSGSPVQTTKSSAGTYTLTITGTPSTGAAVSTTVTVTVN